MDERLTKALLFGAMLLLPSPPHALGSQQVAAMERGVREEGGTR